MAINPGGGYVFLAVSARHPDRIRVGRSATIEDGGPEGGWRIAYARRVPFPQTVERMMCDHLSRLDRDGSGDGEYAAPYGHAQMVLDSLARELALSS